MLIMPKFRVSLFSLALMLAVPFAPQAVAKTAGAHTPLPTNDKRTTGFRETASRYHRFTTGNCLR